MLDTRLASMPQHEVLSDLQREIAAVREVSLLMERASESADLRIDAVEFRQARLEKNIAEIACSLARLQEHLMGTTALSSIHGDPQGCVQGASRQKWQAAAKAMRMAVVAAADRELARRREATPAVYTPRAANVSSSGIGSREDFINKDLFTGMEPLSVRCSQNLNLQDFRHVTGGRAPTGCMAFMPMLDIGEHEKVWMALQDLEESMSSEIKEVKALCSSLENALHEQVRVPLKGVHQTTRDHESKVNDLSSTLRELTTSIQEHDVRLNLFRTKLDAQDHKMAVLENRSMRPIRRDEGPWA